ncbi:hypothetical protein [Mailhella sp.]|uniref:hypothetical protein n=1 Tax=Mailhella sp. TaxID=1981029 RepID=UPI004063FBFE
MYITGGEIQSNVYGGSTVESENIKYDENNKPYLPDGEAYSSVENTNVYITGGKFTMTYKGDNGNAITDKNLYLSAGGDVYEAGTNKVGNALLVIDGTSGDLDFDIGTSTQAFRILTGGLADTSNQNFAKAGFKAKSHVDNGKVILKNIDIEAGRLYAGGAAFSAKSTVTNSELELDNAKILSIETSMINKAKEGLDMGEAPVENSTITLTNGSVISGQDGKSAIEINAGTSILAVDKTITEKNLKGISIKADSRTLRLLDDVKKFDFEMLGEGKWDYQGYARDGEIAAPNKLTQLDVMGKTTIFTNDTAGFTDASIASDASGHTLKIGGTGEAVGNIALTNNSISIVSGTLAAEMISVGGTGRISVDGGSLKTSSDQIFKTALHDNGKLPTDTGGIKESLAGNVVFNSGSLALTDKKYNQAYANDALEAIRKTASDSTATVVMLGRLVGEDNNGMDFDKDDNGNHGSLEVKPGNGWGDKNHVHVHKGKLGLIGGEDVGGERCDLVVLEGNPKDSVKIAVGGTDSASLTLGNEYHTSRGKLDGNISVNAGSSLNVVKNGDYVVEGLSLAEHAVANINGVLESTTSLTMKSGSTLNVEVTGSLTATELSSSGSISIHGKLESTSNLNSEGDITIDKGGIVKAKALTSKGRFTVTNGTLDVADASVKAMAIAESGTLAPLTLRLWATATTTPACLPSRAS